MSWLRLDADYLDDARIWDAGWEAALLWPPVLALLKQNDGVLDDRTLSGKYLSRKTGCPLKVAEAGVAAIKSVGLLVNGAATWKVHKGIPVTRKGWLSERWAEKGNAPGSWAVGNEPARTLPKVAEPSPTLPKVPDTLPNHSRARCGSVGLSVDVPSVGPEDPEGAQGSILTNPEPPTAPEWEVEDRLIARWFKASARSRQPSGGALDAIRDHLRHHLKALSVEDLETLIDYLAQSDWWRGRSGKHSDDLFTTKPISWLRYQTAKTAVEFDSRVEASRMWKAGGSKAPTNPSGLTKEQQTRVRIANDALWGTYEDYWREKGDRSRPYVRADLDAAMSKSPANAKQYAAMPEWLKDEWVMRIERIRTHVRRVS